ncbi:MAG: hypothetical protein K9W44_13405 [Candidatus Lokiarchaeota archaeon]|nr:hypothetical protein [Candidatus Harpocratesius repetitus]
MKILSESPFIVGKIKVWHSPQYKIEEFGNNLKDIKSIIETNLNCQTDIPYYKKPAQNRVLGRIHPTFRFEFIKMNDNLLDQMIDHINLGFGQNGYYFDINIRGIDFTNEEWKEISQKTNQLSKLIEEIMEKRFYSYCYPNCFQNEKKSPLFWEVSNFDLTFIDEEEKIYSQFPEMKIIIERTMKNHEPILKNHDDIIFPALQLKIESELRFSNFQLFQRTEKYLENDRYLVIRSVDPKKKIWNISSRGVPFDFLFNYIEKLFK